jgi:glycosyltransferase involved in cell wall biosynthesis
VEESAFLAVGLTGRGGPPVIYDMQSSLAEQMAEIRPFKNRLARRLLQAAEAWLVRSATVVVTSPGLAERAQSAGPRARVHEWRYPGLVAEVAPESVTRARRELGIRPGQPVVLYTGNFSHYQGLSLLFDAIPSVLEDVPDTVFVFVGANGSRRTEKLRGLAERLPRAAYRLVARQPRERIPTFLAMATIAVSPRIYGSNLPSKVLEYMAAGRALVATSIPAHWTVLDDGLAVLAEPEAASLAEAISGLLRDPERIETLEANVRAYAQEHLAWKGFVDTVGSVIAAAGASV